MSDIPLLLVPGLLCDRAVWQPQIDALSHRRACRVADHGMAASLEAMAQRVLDDAPAGRFALAGHSMGGRVALEVVRLAPGRVDRLALFDTGYEARAAGPAGVAERATRLALLEVARQRGMRAMAREWAFNMVHPTQHDSLVFEQILDMFDRKTPDVFEAQITALLARPDATALLGGIGCPTLVLCGRQDLWSPVARHEQMAAAIPGATLRVIEESGHMCTMETPQPVIDAMIEWLDAPSAVDR